MPKLIDRLQQLGLHDFVFLNSQDCQIKMGRRLKSLLMDYIAGTLRDIHGQPVADGPLVKQFRQNVHLIGGLDNYLAQLSRNREWATNNELELLSELVGVNFGVKFGSEGRISILAASKESEQPTIIIQNTDNRKWDAVIAGSQSTDTVHDGNCGYHAFAQSLQHLVNPAPIMRSTHEPQIEEFFVKQSLDSYYAAAKKFNEVHSDPNDPRLKQIEQDRQLAFRLAMGHEDGAARPTISRNPYTFQPHRQKSCAAEAPCATPTVRCSSI